MYSCTLSLTSAIDMVGGQSHAPATSPTPRKKDPVPILQVWMQNPVRTGAENFAPPPARDSKLEANYA